MANSGTNVNLTTENNEDTSEMSVDTFIENLEESLEKIIDDSIEKKTNDGESTEIKENSYKSELDKKIKEMGSWINDTFLKDLLQKNFQENIDIVNFDIEAAVNPGDNYLSTLYRTNVEYMKKDSDEILILKLMIKGAPSEESIVNMLDEMGIFEKEIFIYNHHFPKMRVIFDKYIDKSVPFMAPLSYKCVRFNTIVMEDLKAKNYVMANRKDQLDYKHAIEVLKAIARFHALSHKVFEENPEYIESLSKDGYIDNPTMDALFLGGTPAFLEVMKTWEGCAQYEPVIKDLSEAWNQRLLTQVLKPGKVNVLNHGDIWINNVLFKYNQDGTLNHSVLVDYQITRYCSPALDILFFLFASVKTDVLISEMNVLLRVYYNIFMETIKAVQSQLNYPFLEFKEDFEDHIAFGFFALIVMKPIFLADSKVDISGQEEETENDEHVLTKNFKNPNYKKSTIPILHHLESMGFVKKLHEYVIIFLKSNSSDEEKIDESSKTPSSFLSRVLSSISKIINEPICT